MYKEFIEGYLSRLTDARSLIALLAEARTNHRVQKLLVPYLAKDRETFEGVRKLSRQDFFAQRLLDHLAIVLHDLADGKVHNREDMKSLVEELNQVTGLLSLPKPVTPIEPWEFAGYTDALNRYLLEDKLTAVEEKREMAEQYNQLMKQLNDTDET